MGNIMMDQTGFSTQAPPPWNLLGALSTQLSDVSNQTGVTQDQCVFIKHFINPVAKNLYMYRCMYLRTNEN